MSATTTETVNQTATAAPVVDENATSTAGAGEEAAVAKRELQGHRIHIGNLPFKATEDEVRALASKADVEILEVVIPQRFGRPAGYAFVALKTEEDSKKVLEALADEEIDGRKIKLQVARSPEEQAERRAEVTEKRKAEKEAAKAEKAKLAEEKKAAEGGDAAAATEGAGEAGAAKPKKKRASKKGPRRRVPGDEDEEAEVEATEAPAADAAAPTANGTEAKPAKPKKKKSTKSKKAREARIDGGAPTEGEDGAPAAATEEPKAEQPKEKKEKKAKKPRQVPTGEPSPNTVFVANLPFEVDDAALAAIFTNLSIRVTSAKVVTGVRRNREGRTFRGSRGFGFVEVEDASQQKEAVEKVEGTLIGDRKLSAKIANEMKEADAEEAAKEAQKGDAAATASPAVTSADAA